MSFLSPLEYWGILSIRPSNSPDFTGRLPVFPLEIRGLTNEKQEKAAKMKESPSYFTEEVSSSVNIITPSHFNLTYYTTHYSSNAETNHL